jgi:hypothetical protein
VVSVQSMDPRSQHESTYTPLTDLDLLLTEADREDLELSTPRPADPALDADDIDQQILAGLVAP